MIKPKVLLPLLLVASSLLSPVMSYADAMFSIRQDSSGKYIISGTGMNTVAAFQFNVMYKAAQLSSPVVSTSNGLLANAMVQHNPAVPGIIRFAALQATNFPASGEIATITFTGSGTGSSVWMASTLCFDSTQSSIPCTGPTQQADTSTTGGGETGSGDGNSGTPYTPTGGSTMTSQSGGAATTGIGGVIGGSVTIPSTTPAATTDDTGSKPREQVASPAQQSEQQVASNPPSSPESRTAVPESRSRQDVAPDKGASEPAPLSVPSVLERFRLFQGERSSKNLIALFDRKNVPNFVQTPAVAIADGKQTVKVTISKVRGDRAPNFAFRSVRYVSVSEVADGEWQIEVRPDKDATQASISVLVNGVAQELPLAVAPMARVDLIKPGTVTEADFQHFLKERGTPSAPKYDLNKDGKRDYLDDYIFTANYLVEREKQPAKEKVPAKSAAGK